MAVRFSADGSAAISRRVSPVPTTSAQRDLRDYYEIERCLEFIASNPTYEKVHTGIALYVTYEVLVCLLCLYVYMCMCVCVSCMFTCVCVCLYVYVDGPAVSRPVTV